MNPAGISLRNIPRHAFWDDPLKYLFYRRNLTPLPESLEQRPELTMELWRPRMTHPIPPEGSVVPFGIWSLFHYLRIFSTREYAVLLMRQEGRVVGRACIIPAHFNFPFMKSGDLQVAGIWTDPALRRGGLGFRAVQEITRRLEDPHRVLWYMVREENAPSIRLAEKAHFQLCGRGERKRWLGLIPLGYFRVTDWCQS